MEFKKWLEQIATDIGSGNITTNNGDDDNDGDDEGWEWEEIFKKYGKQIEKWFNSKSKSITNLKRICDYYVYNEQHEDEPKYIQHGVSMSNYDGGYGHIEVCWELKENDPAFETMESAVKQQLINCDLWDYLGIEKNQAYDTLDRGDFFEFLFYYILKFLYEYSKTRNKEGAFRTFSILKRYKTNDGSTPEQDLTNEFIEKYEYRFKEKLNPNQVRVSVTGTEATNYVKLWDYINITGIQRYAFQVNTQLKFDKDQKAIVNRIKNFSVEDIISYVHDTTAFKKILQACGQDPSVMKYFKDYNASMPYRNELKKIKMNTIWDKLDDDTKEVLIVLFEGE